MRLTQFASIIFFALIALTPLIGFAQVVIIDSVYIENFNLPDTTNYFNDRHYEYYKAIIPEGYNELNPPALAIGCHGLGANYDDFFGGTACRDTATAWGWITLAINGEPPRSSGGGYTHWFSNRVQFVMDRVMDALMQRYPFDPDSIFMLGSSMGAAAGMQYHNCHLDPKGYMLAGTGSASGILDFARRAREQILYEHYTMNVSMHVEFGPLDTIPEACTNYRYKNNSAVVFWDTTNSRHYNLAWLPIVFAAGEQERHDTAAMDLIAMYGNFMRAETLLKAPGTTHGWPNMNPDTTMHWLRNHAGVFRHPTFQNVACDSARRCYDIEFKMLRNDTCVARAFMYSDSILFEDDWYLTNPRLTLLRNASEVILHRELPQNYFSDTVSVTNLDTVPVNVRIRYPNPPIAGYDFAMRPPLQSMIEFRDNAVVVYLPEIPPNYSGTGVFRYVGVKEGYSLMPANIQLTAYPNPFNSATMVRLAANNGGSLNVNLYDITGRRVKSIPRKYLHTSGMITFSLPAGNLSSGTYYLAGTFGSKPVNYRLTVLK